MVCLASCSGTTAFSGPSAGVICLMPHMNGWVLSVSPLLELVTKVLQAFAVAYSVVEQLEIREALRDWCGELSVRREHRSEST